MEHDPATHQSDGQYDPVRHLAMTLTIDRRFAIVQQITPADRRNAMVRKLLLFDALDIVEGLLPGHNVDSITNLSKARARVDELEAVMPPDVQRVLMPRCRAAVEALDELRGGFWVPSSRTATGIRVSNLTGSDPEIPYGRAATMAMRLIRNGHHGYVSVKFQAESANRALLTLHDGRIPEALPDLAFFQLVRLIAFADLLDPKRLRTRRPVPS